MDGRPIALPALLAACLGLTACGPSYRPTEPLGRGEIRYHLDVWAAHMSKMAPEGADTTSWR